MCFKGSSKSSGGKCTICYYVTVTMQIAFNDEKVLLFMLLAFPYLSSHANQMPRYNPEAYCQDIALFAPLVKPVETLV